MVRYSPLLLAEFAAETRKLWDAGVYGIDAVPGKSYPEVHMAKDAYDDAFGGEIMGASFHSDRKAIEWWSIHHGVRFFYLTFVGGEK